MKRITVPKEEILLFYPDGTPRENVGKYIDFNVFIQSCVENVGQEMTTEIILNYFKMIKDRKIYNH